jgi:hypothetical protein
MIQFCGALNAIIGMNAEVKAFNYHAEKETQPFEPI